MLHPAFAFAQLGEPAVLGSRAAARAFDRSAVWRNRPAAPESDSTLLPASATENFDYRDEQPAEEELDADKVFAKLSSLKSSTPDEDEEE